jgi:hypothetical protein
VSIGVKKSNGSEIDRLLSAMGNQIETKGEANIQPSPTVRPVQEMTNLNIPITTVITSQGQQANNPIPDNHLRNSTNHITPIYGSRNKPYLGGRSPSRSPSREKPFNQPTSSTTGVTTRPIVLGGGRTTNTVQSGLNPLQ